MRKLLSAVLSFVVLICSFSGTFTLAANIANEAIRAAFEEYVASTVFKTDGLSSTYSDAGLLQYLQAKGHSVQLVDSYLQHAKAGFTTSAVGYESLFRAENGYVSVILKDAEGNQNGYLATIPAYTYDHTRDITTVSKAEDFTVENGTVTAYNGNANILVIDKPISKDINWGVNAANIKVIVYSGGQTFDANFHNGAAFGAAKLPNLAAFAFERANFATGGDVNLFKDNNVNLTHISLPATGVYMVPNHFLNGRAGVVRVDNTKAVERFGWYAFGGTSITSLEGGQDRGELYTDGSSFYTKAAEQGVTPVFIFYHKNGVSSGPGGSMARWNVAVPPIIYATEATRDNVLNGTIEGMKNAAEWRVLGTNVMTAAATAKAKLDAFGELSSNSSALLSAVNAAITENYTAAWTAFDADGENVVGTMTVSDGTDTVSFNVNAPKARSKDSLEDAFREYVNSTLFTDSGLSSTYSDKKLTEALAKQGFEVVVKDSYLQHAKAGFTTGATGYETLFASEDGYVSAVLECGGESIFCTAPIPSYTYDHTADITTVSKDGEFTVVDGVVTAYKGNAHIVVLDKPIADFATMDWNGNAEGTANSNIKVIVYKGDQQFAAAHTKLFGGQNLPNLAAFIFENGSFNPAADIKMFQGALNLTHVSLPAAGTFMVPNWFLTSVASVVRVDNTAKVERFGWWAFNGTNIVTLEGGMGRNEFYTDSLCFNTLAMNKGVTPVFTFHHKNVPISGAAVTEARWATNSDGIMPIVYVDKTMYDKIHASDNRITGFLKSPADWRLSDDDFCQVLIVINEYLDSLVYVGKRGEDLIARIQKALLANPLTADRQLSFSWNGTWTVENDLLSGDLTVTDANGMSATIAFSATYKASMSDDELEQLLDRIVPDKNVNTTLEFAAQLADEVGCDPSGIFVHDFYFLRPEPGLKDADGILVKGRRGYAAATVSVSGSNTLFTKTWVMEPEMEDLGKLTVSSDDEFTFERITSGVMSVKAYNGNAQKLLIPAVGGQISGNWTVKNKENVQVVVMNNYSVGFEGGIFHDFPNLKAVIFNDEATGWYTADMQNVPYVTVFKNVPSLKYVQWGKGAWKEYAAFAAIPSLEALPLPDGYVEQTANRKLNVSNFATSGILDLVIPSGFQTTGTLASHQKLFRIGDTALTLCEAWVRAQYAADRYDGAIVKDRLAAHLRFAYGSAGAITSDWTKWTVSASNDSVNATFSLSDGQVSLDVAVSSHDVTVGTGETVAERLQSAIDRYPYRNDTTEDDLYEALSLSILDEKGYSVSVDDFYRYKSINGAKDKDGILVPGTDGVVTATVTVTTPVGNQTLYVNRPIQAQYDTLTFATVSKDSEFTVVKEANETVVVSYNGSAEKVIVPEGVTDIDLFWMDGNSEAVQNIRALVLPSTLRVLPYALCAMMPNLEAVYIHDNTVNDFMNDEYAFDHCYSLRYVHLSEGFTEIPANFFNHAKSLAAVHIPDNVTYIGQSAFEDTSISEMVLGPNIIEIGAAAFLDSYAPSCNFSSMDFTAKDMAQWRKVSAAVVEEARKLIKERGTYHRVFTVLNNEMLMSANSLRGGGLPTNRGSHILADDGGWAYEDLIAYGYRTDRDPGNFDGGTVQDLSMTLAQAAAFAQYRATALVLDNTTDANAILNRLSQVVGYADGVTVEWKDKLTFVRATETKKGSAKGTAVLKTADGNTFEITVDEVVSYAISESCQNGVHLYDGNCDTECNGCGATRAASEHTYSNNCDAECDVCGAVRAVTGHQYDNACDTDCNECGDRRTTDGHRYDHACDNDCNECGTVRLVIGHQYGNACDTDCNVCGKTREPSDHAYDDILDPDCNECGTVREIVEVKLNAPDKRVYSIGTKEIDVTGGWIELTYTNGQTGRANLTAAMIKGFDGSVLGKQTLTVVCGAAVEFFDITVVKHNTLPTVTVGNAQARPNQTVTIAVRLDNNPGILSANFAITYDASRLEFVSCEAQDFVGLTYELTENGLLLLKWIDVGTSNITADGVFAQLIFKVDANAPTGETVLSVDYRDADVFDRDFENVLFNTADGTVTVTATASGDLNGDGVVNNKDVGLIQRYINTWDNVAINEYAADVNRDGKINNKDLGLLQRYVNGWNVDLQ